MTEPRFQVGLRWRPVDDFNVDLIYGLPHQTVASCLDTVSQCVELRPDRFSVFGYAHVPSFKKHQRKIDDASLPDSLERHHQSDAIADALKQAGYLQIGLDHFALPDDEMAAALRLGRLRRNFQGYTTDASNILLGFGASAIGHLPQGYVQNEVRTRAYSESIASGRLATVKGYGLTGDDRLRAEIIERIMCDFGVDLDEHIQFVIDAMKPIAAEALASLIHQGRAPTPEVPSVRTQSSSGGKPRLASQDGFDFEAAFHYRRRGEPDRLDL
jgi:oxygen-independent coproporphyrinogen-3 oxidase